MTLRPTIAITLAAATALLAVTACRKDETAAKTQGKVVARVGSREITSAEVTRAVFPQGRPVGAKVDRAVARRVLDQLIDRALILEWAGRNGVKVGDAEVNARFALIEADYGARGFESYLKSQGLNAAVLKTTIRDDLFVEAAVEKEVVNKVSVSYDDVVTYYNTHGGEFQAPAEYHLLQIVTADRAQADEALAKLTYGATFEEIAREVSLSPDRYQGGDVGYTTLDALPAEVAKVVATLAPGATSPVISTPYGFEIVKVLAIRPAGQVPLAEVRVEIEDRLRKQEEAAAYAAWVTGLRKGAKINVDEKTLGMI